MPVTRVRRGGGVGSSWGIWWVSRRGCSPADGLAKVCTGLEKIEQDRLQRMRGGGLHLHDAQALAGFAQGLEVRAEAAHVVFAGRGGIKKDVTARLEVLESRGGLEIKIQFRGIQ